MASVHLEAIVDEMPRARVVGRRVAHVIGPRHGGLHRAPWLAGLRQLDLPEAELLVPVPIALLGLVERGRLPTLVVDLQAQVPCAQASRLRVMDVCAPHRLHVHVHVFIFVCRRAGGGLAARHATRTWFMPGKNLTPSGLNVSPSVTAEFGLDSAGRSLRARVSTRFKPCGGGTSEERRLTSSGKARFPAGIPAEWCGPTCRFPPPNGSGAKSLDGPVRTRRPGRV
jgi:hypothetical protein